MTALQLAAACAVLLSLRVSAGEEQREINENEIYAFTLKNTQSFYLISYNFSLK